MDDVPLAACIEHVSHHNVINGTRDKYLDLNAVVDEYSKCMPEDMLSRVALAVYKIHCINAHVLLALRSECASAVCMRSTGLYVFF